MMKQLPSHYIGARPIHEIKSRMKSLDMRYSKMCRTLKNSPNKGLEKQQQFISIAHRINSEMRDLRRELDLTSAILGKMREKHDFFTRYIASGPHERGSMREEFLGMYDCVPEHMFHELPLLGDEIMRLGGEKETVVSKAKKFLKSRLPVMK